MSEDPTLPLHCVNHPQRETMLRCNRCDQPICGECAVLTPTGYRCKSCLRSQQKIFDTARAWDYVLAIFIGGLLSLIGSFFVPMLGFFTLFVAPLVGMGIAEVIRWATGRRRSRKLFIAAAAAVVLGALPLLLINLLPLLMGGGLGSLFSLVWYGVYVFFATSTVYTRLSGIHLR